MADYSLDAMLELRKFIWSDLQTLGMFDINDYWSDNLNTYIVPIIPVQQTPEMNQFLSGKKHIVYDKIGIAYDDTWLICTEQVLFTIYSTQISDINMIRNYMIDMFRRMDESAQDINAWENLSSLFKFHTIYVADISATEPSKELQGFFAADVILEIKYSRVTDGSGRFI